MMTACGRETCQGRACGNFGASGCKGVRLDVPPWGYAQVYNARSYKPIEESKMKAYELEAAHVALDAARAHVVAAGLDAHVVSDIDHIIATVVANKTADADAEREEQETEGWTK